MLFRSPAAYASRKNHTLELNQQGAVEYRGGPIPGRVAMSIVYVQSATGRLVTVWDRRCFDSVDIQVSIYATGDCEARSWSNLRKYRGSGTARGNVGAMPILDQDKCYDHVGKPWCELWIDEESDKLPHLKCEKCESWVPVAFLCLNSHCSAPNKIEFGFSTNSSLKSCPTDYLTIEEEVKVIQANMPLSSATADDSSDAGGEEEGKGGNDQAPAATEQHRGCDVLYDTGDMDIDISHFNGKLSGAFFNLGQGMFDVIKSDTVSLWKYVLRICCGIQLSPDRDHFDPRCLYGRHGGIVSDQTNIKDTPVKSLFEIRKYLTEGSDDSHRIPILGNIPLYGNFAKPPVQMLIDSGFLPIVSSYKIIAHNGTVCSNEFVRVMIEAAMEQFEWQRNAMSRQDFVDMVQEYSLVWRAYKVGVNSPPDASLIENIHLNRTKHQALASRLTMIPKAYIMRFGYNDDHRIQRGVLARLIGRHMTEEQTIDRASRKDELSHNRPEHRFLIDRHDRQELPFKDDIMNNVLLNDGSSQNFLSYMTAVPTQGGTEASEYRRLRLIDPDNDCVQAVIGSSQAWEKETESARVATTHWERRSKDDRWMVESPQYKT